MLWNVAAFSFLSAGLAKPTNPYQSNTAWDFTISHDKNGRSAGTNSIISNYKLRGKTVDPSVLGVDAVQQYAGYLDDNDKNKHLFYCMQRNYHCSSAVHDTDILQGSLSRGATPPMIPSFFGSKAAPAAPACPASSSRTALPKSPKI